MNAVIKQLHDAPAAPGSNQAEADRVFAAEQARLKEFEDAFIVRAVAAATLPVTREFPADALGMLEDVLQLIAEPIGQECCGRVGEDCCGDAMPVYRSIDEIATELNQWRNAMIALARPVEAQEAA